MIIGDLRNEPLVVFKQNQKTRKVLVTLSTVKVTWKTVSDKKNEIIKLPLETEQKKNH